MPGISLSLNCTMNMLTSGTGILVDDAFDITFISDGSSLKLQGSSDGGNTYADIMGSHVTGDGATQLLSVSLERCPFDHVAPVFSGGTNAKCYAIRQSLRQQPQPNLDRTKNKTIQGPQLGTA